MLIRKEFLIFEVIIVNYVFYFFDFIYKSGMSFWRVWFCLLDEVEFVRVNFLGSRC